MKDTKDTKDFDILNDKLPLDILIVSVILLTWSTPIILAYTFIKFGIGKPIRYLFGGKKK